MTAEYTLFSISYETFTKLYHILGLIMHFNKLKGTKSYKVCSDNKGIKLEVNNRKIAGKPHNTWRLNITLPITYVQRNLKRYFKIC